MSLPIYYVRLHEGHWRIRFEDRYFGQYDTAQAAAEAATRVATSHLTPNLQTRVVVEQDGQRIDWHLKD